MTAMTTRTIPMRMARPTSSRSFRMAGSIRTRPDRRVGYQTATHRSPGNRDPRTPDVSDETARGSHRGSDLPEPRALTARPDPPRPRPRGRPRRAAPRAREVLRDRLGRARRVLHGARFRPAGAGDRGSSRADARRAHAAADAR